MAAFILAETGAGTFLVRKAVFRMILARAKSVLRSPDDIEELQLSELTEGISFFRLEEPQRSRIVGAVRLGVERLKSDLISGAGLEEPMRGGAREHLDELLEFFDSNAIAD